MTAEKRAFYPEEAIRELADAGWRREGLTLWRAPCGCLFRGPARAWEEMNGTHLADHIAAGVKS